MAGCADTGVRQCPGARHRGHGHRATDAGRDRPVWLGRHGAGRADARLHNHNGGSPAQWPVRSRVRRPHAAEADGWGGCRFPGLGIRGRGGGRCRESDPDCGQPVHAAVPAVRRRRSPATARLPDAARDARDDARRRPQGGRHDLRKADRYPGRLQHPGRLRDRETTGRRSPVFVGRCRPRWIQPAYDHGKHRPDHVTGLVAGQPAAGLRLVRG